MKRKLKWLAIVLAVLLLGLGTALLLWPRDRITAASLKLIHLGMPKEDVEEILGRPGTNVMEFERKLIELEAKAGKPPFVPMSEVLVEPEGFEFTFDCKCWLGRGGIILIQFDREAEVQALGFVVIRAGQPNIIERLRDWLGW
jgi:hypothetical protein